MCRFLYTPGRGGICLNLPDLKSSSLTLDSLAAYLE